MDLVTKEEFYHLITTKYNKVQYLLESHHMPKNGIYGIAIYQKLPKNKIKSLIRILGWPIFKNLLTPKTIISKTIINLNSFASKHKKHNLIGWHSPDNLFCNMICYDCNLMTIFDASKIKPGNNYDKIFSKLKKIKGFEDLLNELKIIPIEKLGNNIEMAIEYKGEEK